MADENKDASQDPLQENLFSLEIISLKPIMGSKTAQLTHTALASDGWEYAVKSCDDGRSSLIKAAKNPSLVPASEWICNKLADTCGIATPPCQVITDTNNNQTFFGSRYDLSALATPVSILDFIDHLADSDLLQRQVWAIYAFDQFVFNIDRNTNNYLYSIGRDEKTIVQAFDFGLSSLVLGWPNQTGTNLLPYGCPTTDTWRSIKKITGTNQSCIDAALSVLGNLSRINVDFLEMICDRMPPSWLPPLQRTALLSWWDSQRHSRIESVRKEVLR
ncbi:hypothetical protein HH682_13655 [Rosenbergiella sp. S61]|uniref:HipA-like C-terminal domain-containing protein n=1 Tax=Rosenbergiella gaditana TaxID=2726987 RepID=A0ABS5SZE4_9GAMM|nr:MULTISPECIES: hypothetical protein [Rosenbergiella]MBT0725444.1 hypothetical protein [Rosenbergiella gaditana]